MPPAANAIEELDSACWSRQERVLGGGAMMRMAYFADHGAIAVMLISFCGSFVLVILFNRMK